MKKTHKATIKRFKLSGTGKIMHNRQKDNSHLKANKTRAQKARVNNTENLKAKKEIKKIKYLMS